MRGAEPEPAPVTPVYQADPVAPTNAPQPVPGPDPVRQAIEQLRRDTVPASDTGVAPPQDRTSALEERLDRVEQTLRLQHQGQLEAMRRSSRTVLLAGVLLSAVVLAGIAGAAFLLSRTVNRLSEVTRTLSVGILPALRAPRAAWLHAGAGDPATTAGALLSGSIEQLERRVGEMEQAAGHRSIPAPIKPRAQPEGAPPPGLSIQPGAETSAVLPGRGYRPGAAAATPSPAGEVPLLLGKGQALLHLGRAEEALRFFDDALALDPENAEVYVRRGVALEKLERIEEALGCYNRAIDIDRSMIAAYLHKGAVCNRLQRFHEALDCYDQVFRAGLGPRA